MRVCFGLLSSGDVLYDDRDVGMGKGEPRLGVTAVLIPLRHRSAERECGPWVVAHGRCAAPSQSRFRHIIPGELTV